MSYSSVVFVRFHPLQIYFQFVFEMHAPKGMNGIRTGISCSSCLVEFNRQRERETGLTWKMWKERISTLEDFDFREWRMQREKVDFLAAVSQKLCSVDSSSTGSFTDSFPQR